MIRFASACAFGSTALVAVLALLALCGPARAAGNQFVSGFSDLPLMQGLATLDDQSLLFDNPDGRIVQAAARGSVAATDIRDFYARTLPELGWRAQGRDRWSRDGEALALEIAAASPQRGPRLVTVRFLLNPN